MIKLNFKDGSTLEFDLTKEDDLKQWLEWSPEEDFQERITGIGILHNGNFHAMALPKPFRHVRFQSELLYNVKNGERRIMGEQIICRCENQLLSLLVYTFKNPPIATRTTLVKIVKKRWNVDKLRGKT